MLIIWHAAAGFHTGNITAAVAAVSGHSSRRRRAKRKRREAAKAAQPIQARACWRLIVRRPGPIAIEWLQLVVAGDVGYLEFRVEADPRLRGLQRGWAREIVRQLKYAEIPFRWEQAP